MDEKELEFLENDEELNELQNSDSYDFDTFSQICKIKVIGVGGGGNNAINRMIESGLQGVEFWVANTDMQVLIASKTKNRLNLGKSITKGLGAGANPEIGKQAAMESEDKIREILEGSDMVFLAAGMGGGTGTGATPIFARIAKEMGILTIGIVTRPFTFEGKNRNSNATEGIQELKKYVDSLIIVSNDKLLSMNGAIPMKDSFKLADDVLRQSVQSITDLVAVPATINLDFADVKTVMSDKGTAMIGFGIGRGEKKAIDAANKAISSPLLESSFLGARNAIINITGGSSVTLYDANDAVEIIRQASGTDLNTIFGFSINEALDDEMIVTVIATDFDEEILKNRAAYVNTRRPEMVQERLNFDDTPTTHEENKDDFIPPYLKSLDED